MANKIPPPLPIGVVAHGCDYGYGFAGTYDTHEARLQRRRPVERLAHQGQVSGTCRRSGTVVEKPSTPSLFATGGAKAPHRDPDTKMVDSAEEKKKQKAKEKKELQERLGKERFARLQQLQKVVEGRSDQLLGLCVRIARSQLGYTFGLEIDEPSSDAMALINARIQALLPGARPR